jgi:ATP-dependent protease HslVU (ClpYQ) peptidase subunit
MSVIVAVKENGVVYMGADTQTTIGRRKQIGLNETAFKIHRLENGILVGFCGRVAAKQTILSLQDLFVLDKNGQLTKKHIVNQIVPKLVDKMEQIGDEERGSLDVSIILAYKDKLYRITSSLSVICLNDHGKAGAGAYFVDYYLQERKDLPVKDRIVKSLMASAKRCDSVCGPYVLIDTKNLEYEIIDMGGRNY